jgi:hypothetical protein
VITVEYVDASSQLTALKKLECSNDNRTNLQETSKSLECSNIETLVEDSRPTASQTRTASIEIANNQTDSTVLSKPVVEMAAEATKLRTKRKPAGCL